MIDLTSMEFLNYLVSNIPLFSICAVMLFLALRNIRVRRNESLLFIAFTTIVLFLSVVVTMERYYQAHSNVIGGTIFTSCGYIFRPILLYIFILLTNMEQKRSNKFYLILGIPLLVNFIIYMFPLFFGVSGLNQLVFYYVDNGDGTATFMRGTFLNFFSHAISFFYLIALIYISTVKFHGKHRRDALVITLCVIIIFTTVLAETLSGRNDLLNIVCEICAMINYIFIMTVNSSKDPLTNLYDRRTYYEDISRYKELVNGVIQIDMNGLKFLNDNYGHNVGDEALATLADIFEESIHRPTMCTYRLSGDEFLILMYQGKEETLKEVVDKIEEKIDKTNYSVALGYLYYNKDSGLTYEEALKKSEELMYKDKDKHYASVKGERRKAI